MPSIVMRRFLTPTVAVLAVIAQLALGMSAHLGLVLCIGDDHAAIELSSDDCCASHGQDAPNRVATLARDCCSDIPLYAAARPLSDVPRPFAWLASAVALAPLPATVPAGGHALVSLEIGGAPPTSSLVRRSTVLRV